MAANVLGHRALAITDHVGLEDPKPILDRLHQEAKGWSDGPMVTMVGVELTLLPPARISDAARHARSLGAEIVIVHGETIGYPVPAGTNHAALESGEIDILAHPGILELADAELARDQGVILELSGRTWHCLANGHVARFALQAHADLIVDSDAHDTHELMGIDLARRIARGAGLDAGPVERAITETPRKLLRRCRKI